MYRPIAQVEKNLLDVGISDPVPAKYHWVVSCPAREEVENSIAIDPMFAVLLRRQDERQA